MQKCSPYLYIAALMLIGSGCTQSKIGEMDFPEGTVQHAVRSSDIQWKPCPPHLPPGCEITVLEGKVSVAFGVDGTHENAETFGPWDYYVNARDAVHTVWADEDSIVQVTGIGPWEAHFIEDHSFGKGQ